MHSVLLLFTVVHRAATNIPHTPTADDENWPVRNARTAPSPSLHTCALQRDIDRQGWPVTRKLDEMRSLVKLFESFGKLFPELQPDMEQIKCLEPEADAMDAQIQEYTGQVGPLLIALTLL